MSSVELEHITVRRSSATLLDDVSLDLADGELMGVIGSSGAGKTTLLRAVAGLEPLAAGTVTIGGLDMTRSAPVERGVAMVFQEPVLIPHLDVRRNIAFPLELRHEEPAEIAMRVAAESRALHIVELLGRSPRDLSAGESQLVQVAKALVRRPNVLLLDEPLARLDASVSHQLRVELRTLQQGYGVTTFVATNDPVEAMSLPDRLVVLDAGRVIQIGTPVDVYERPANLVAAACTGHASILTAEVEADDDGFWLVHPSFRRRARRRSLSGYVGAFVTVALRPRWITLTTDGPVVAEVTEVDLISGSITVALVTEQRRDTVEIATPALDHHRGERVAFRIDEFALFDPLTGDRLQ
jgi:ABC-type sugar transport system ATPase subunit